MVYAKLVVSHVLAVVKPTVLVVDLHVNSSRFVKFMRSLKVSLLLPNVSILLW